MNIYYYKNELPFKYPFTISGGRTKTHQPTLVVVLELANWFGIGEAPAITYYNITVDEMAADIEKYRKQIEGFAFTEPQRFWHFLHHLIPNNPFLVCALDIAAWDLFGHMHKQNLYQLWNTKWENLPVTDYTIGIDTISNMVNKMIENPWPIYKIKLGTNEDIEIMQALRKHTNSVFRVDANAGWQLDEALYKIPILKDLGVELVEQPLEKNNWDGMKILFEKSCLPLFADESCVFKTDVEKCYQHFHGINIKLTKCSGITPALEMVAKAKELGMKVMMGSMNENSIGSAAIANFLPQLDYVDMDGPLLLTKDLATGLHISSSNCMLDGKYGLGIHPNL